MGKLQENLMLLRQTRAATLEMVRDLPQERIDRRPSPKDWSVGEVLDHLVKSGELYRKEIVGLVELARQGKTPYVRKTVQEIDFAPSFLPKSMLPMLDVPFTMMTMFVPQIMRDTMIRYSSVLKGQTPEIARPAQGRPAAELIGELQRSLLETEQALSRNADLDWGAMAIHHPLLGRNNVPQMLRLTAMHERRHQDQIRALLAPRAA
jgi:hypothetical protein